MREFKVGESVQDKNYGIGYVAAIDHTSYAPVFVEFLKGFSQHYHLDGRCSLSDSGPGLFHADEIPGQATAQTLTAAATMTRRDEFAIRIGVALARENGFPHTPNGRATWAQEAVWLAEDLIDELDRTKKEAQS